VGHGDRKVRPAQRHLVRVGSRAGLPNAQTRGVVAGRSGMAMMARACSSRGKPVRLIHRRARRLRTISGGSAVVLASRMTPRPCATICWGGCSIPGVRLFANTLPSNRLYSTKIAFVTRCGNHASDPRHLAISRACRIAGPMVGSERVAVIRREMRTSSRLSAGRTADDLRALPSPVRETDHPRYPLVRRFRVRVVGNCQPAAAGVISFVKCPGIQGGKVCHSRPMPEANGRPCRCETRAASERV